jgi:hypothetical protein
MILSFRFLSLCNLNRSSSSIPLFSYIAIKENNVYLEQRGVGASCSLYKDYRPFPSLCVPAALRPSKLPNKDHPLLLSIERNVVLYHPSTQLVPVYFTLSTISHCSRLKAGSQIFCVCMAEASSVSRSRIGRGRCISLCRLGNDAMRRLDVNS